MDWQVALICLVFALGYWFLILKENWSYKLLVVIIMILTMPVVLTGRTTSGLESLILLCFLQTVKSSVSNKLVGFILGVGLLIIVGWTALSQGGVWSGAGIDTSRTFMFDQGHFAKLEQVKKLAMYSPYTFRGLIFEYRLVSLVNILGKTISYLWMAKIIGLLNVGVTSVLLIGYIKFADNLFEILIILCGTLLMVVSKNPSTFQSSLLLLPFTLSIYLKTVKEISLKYLLVLVGLNAVWLLTV